jgi:type I restriction enzyme S subunit
MNKVMTLMNDLIELIAMGPFGSDIKVDNFVNEGVPVLNGSNVSSIKLIETSFKYVTPEKSKALKKANAKRGDIVITHRGTVGQISYIPEDSKYDNYVISQSQFRVSLKRDLVDPIYFTYYFHTDEGQKRLLSFKSHVGVPALAQATTNFRLLKFPLISLPTQQKIAKVLSDLDSKIELNNKINTELKAMAKTLYNYWFVQFDFPDKNGKPYKSSGGKMVWMEELKRDIPEGWVMKDLGNLINIFDSKRIPLSRTQREKRIGKIPYYGATSIMGYVDDYIFDDEYILLAEDGSVMDEKGFPIVQFICGKSWVNNHAHVIQAKEKENNEYIFHLVKTISVIQIMTGSIQMKINQENLRSVKVVCPDEKTLKIFSNFAMPIRKKLINKIQENQELASLRDWLLPMLMNGQVTVADEKNIDDREKDAIKNIR